MYVCDVINFNKISFNELIKLWDEYRAVFRCQLPRTSGKTNEEKYHKIKTNRMVYFLIMVD